MSQFERKSFRYNRKDSLIIFPAVHKNLTAKEVAASDLQGHHIIVHGGGQSHCFGFSRGSAGDSLPSAYPRKRKERVLGFKRNEVTRTTPHGAYTVTKTRVYPTGQSQVIQRVMHEESWFGSSNPLSLSRATKLQPLDALQMLRK